MSDSYTDFKIQDLLEEYGSKGYSLFWLCCELVAQQGKNYRISSGNSGKNWNKIASKILKIPQKEVEEILNYMADLKLIDKKALTIGSLYVPKMKRYSDDYTNKVRRVFGQSSDNIPQDKIRLDKNRIEYILSSQQVQKHIKIIYLFAYKKLIQEFTKSTEQSFIRRNVRAAILLKGYNLEQIGKVMDWLEKNADFKWTLETVSKYIDEDLPKLKSKIKKEEELVVPDYALKYQK